MPTVVRWMPVRCGFCQPIMSVTSYQIVTTAASGEREPKGRDGSIGPPVAIREFPRPGGGRRGRGGQRLTWTTVAGGKPLKCVLLAAE